MGRRTGLADWIGFRKRAADLNHRDHRENRSVASVGCSENPRHDVHRRVRQDRREPGRSVFMSRG